MDRKLTKAEVGLIGQILGVIAVSGLRELITKQVMDAFISSHKNTNVEFDFNRSRPDQYAIDYITEREIILSDKTSSMLEGNLKYELLEGLKNNESIDQITRRLDKIFRDAMPWQLERIARSEIVDAQNAGRVSAYRASGVVGYKMWIAAKGGNEKRVCDLCARLHGQIQPIDKPFVDPVTGGSWQHPIAHPNGRCSTVPLMRLPEKVITISGQTYAADKVVNKIEIPMDLLKSRQKRKAWVVRYANGHAVQCFEDEADADYFIETSKKKDAGWFDFGGKSYRELKTGWSINKKGTKTTMKFMSEDERKALDEKLLSEDKRVSKIEIDAGSLNKREITVKGFHDKKGNYHKPHKRKIRDTTKKDVKKSTSVDEYVISCAKRLSEHTDIMVEIEECNSLISSGKTSKSTSVDSSGVYTSERQKIHKGIIDRLTKGVKPTDDPKVIFIGGGPGSGKGTLTKMISDLDDYIYLNNDEIKKDLPGYKGTHAAYYHDEARDICNMITEKIMTDKLNVVLDTTMRNPEASIKKIKAFKAKGYTTRLMSTNLPVKKALDRAVSRTVSGERRYVPLNFIGDVMEDTNKNQFKYLEYVDKGDIYNTDVTYGAPVILMESKGDDK